MATSKRPLPEIPARGTSLKHTLKEHARSSSVLSYAPSIAPSLLGYIERGSLTSPEPFVSMATAMPVTPCSNEKDSTKDHSTVKQPSDDPFQDSPLSVASRWRNKYSPPFGKNFNLANITIRKHRRTQAQQLSPLDHSRMSESIDETEKAQDVRNVSTSMSMKENEWMCRTPSPVRNDPVSDERLRAPLKRNPDCQERRAFSKKAKEWYDRVIGPDGLLNSPDYSPADDEDEDTDEN